MSKDLVVSSVALAVLLLGACSKPPAGEAAPDAMPTSFASSGASSSASAAPLAVDAAADATSVDAAATDGGAHHILVLRWQVAKSGPANLARVAVTLRAGSATFPVGELDATSADASSSGTPKACALKKTSSKESSFTCGAAPAHNFFTATLKDGSLVITRTASGDGDGGAEKTTEVKRMPVTETALRTLAFKPAALAKAARPKCPKGQVASEATGDWRCTPACSSDADCKAGFFCDVQRDSTPDGGAGAATESACEEESK